MSEIDATDLASTIDTHLAAYCEPDAELRATQIAEVWTSDGELLDPPFDGVGHDGIAAMVDVVLEHYAGHTFRRTTVVDAHHDVARYGWALVGPDGAVAVSGTDVAQVSPDGKLRRVVGFFGDLAAA